MQFVKGRPLLYENRDIRLNVQIAFAKILAYLKCFWSRKLKLLVIKFLKC